MNWSYWKIIKKRPLPIILFLILITMIGIVTWLILANPSEVHELVKKPSIYPSDDNKQSLYIALLSLISSGVTSVIALILPILRKPILELRIEKQPLFSKSEDQNPSSWFHRLYLINNGLLPAENCIGKLLEIRDANGKLITKFDPTPFYWSHQNKNTEFNPVTIFGRGDYAILDILQEKVVIHSDDCKTFNDMKDIDRSDYPQGFSRDFVSATEDEFPSLRLHLPDPEPFPYYEIQSVSPGTKPILIPGTYYLLIGAYAKNGFAKPKWYRLDIELSSQTEISSKLATSKSTFKKALRAESRSFR